MSQPTGGHEKEYTIVLNGRDTVVTQHELTYEELVRLAFGIAPGGDTTVYTVSFRRGEGNSPAGSLVAGQTLKVKNGMLIDVTPTDRS
jgi:hypothetical protein